MGAHGRGGGGEKPPQRPVLTIAQVFDLADHMATRRLRVMRRGNFRKASGWSAAVAAIGLPGLHFHDLRHTGNTLAAQDGVSLADLKARMGHDSVRAAMIYQHGAAEADQKIANMLDQRMREARDDARDQG
jgi:integrase